MTKVIVEGYGTYQIDSNKISELISWLSRNEAVQIRENNTVKEVKNNEFTGRELLNG